MKSKGVSGLAWLPESGCDRLDSTSQGVDSVFERSPPRDSKESGTASCLMCCLSVRAMADALAIATREPMTTS